MVGWLVGWVGGWFVGWLAALSLGPSAAVVLLSIFGQLKHHLLAM